MGTLEEVRIIEPFAPAEGNLAQHSALHQMQDCPIDRGPGGRGVAFAQSLAEFLWPEMLVRAEDQRRHRLTLLGEAEPFGRKEGLSLYEHRLERGLIHDG